MTAVTAGMLARGTLGAGLPYLRAGSGDPLVWLPGVTPHHRIPLGLERRAQVATFKRFLAERQVWWINRRAGLPGGSSMADLARDYARVLADVFDRPVDLLGVSTGGSVALQLAADHPHLVRRLVVVASAYRLGPGRQSQRRAIELLRVGRLRRAAGELMAPLGTGPVSRELFRGLGWLLGTAVVGDGDPDLITTLAAEDGSDLVDRLGEITAPTLVVGGAKDGYYGGDQIARTAELIPNGRLVPLRGGHLAAGRTRRYAEGVLSFLRAPAPTLLGDSARSQS